MRTLRRWGIFYRLLQSVEWTAIAAIALLGGSQKVNPSNPPSWLPLPAFVISKIQTSLASAGPIAAAVLVVTRFARAQIGHPVTWRQVQAILDQLQRDLFGTDGPGHHHQVTLIRRNGWALLAGPWRRKWHAPWGKGRWPRSGWLVPVARSGHGNKNTRCVFLAPDDHDGAEGVAGAAWALGKSGAMHSPIEDLPELNRDTTPEDRKLYAKLTYVPKEWVEWRIRRGKICARSYAGRPIEVNNEMWGVLIIDSRASKLPDKRKLNQASATAAKLLDAVLQGT